jgi:riboflavin kinase/FMN adenylyltransferase
VLIRTDLKELPALGVPLHLALGVFDGVHVGHQAVIGQAVTAAANGGLAGVLTFDPHPACLLGPQPGPGALLATLGHKARLVAKCGIGLFIPLHFDAAFARLEATEFLDLLLAAPLRTIAVGEDWRFGRGRRGDVELLRERTAQAGITLAAVPTVTMDGERVSSTRIRQAVRDGSLAAAARMLGRPYSLAGIVSEGRQLGRKLGFPTANVTLGAVVTPPDGVWAVRVAVAGGEALPGIANLGVRPTVDGATRVLEVHLFDFSADLYGQEIEVEFVRFQRAEMRFASLDLLRAQIAEDVHQVRQWLEDC